MDAARITALAGIAAEPAHGTVDCVALRYTNPALPGRTLVRLTRTDLTEVEDLVLDVVGFERTAATPVGHVRRRAVGFPAWPILHDPDNAEHAMNLVQDLQRVDRLAANRPGPAKDRLLELATILDRSAPHFLPTFWEEAARIFLRHDNRRMAAQFFGRAREAERVHSLPIDEDRHQEVLMEFTLAGAVTAKELANEAKTLPDRCEPAEALERFTSLVIDQARAGIPPYAAVATDLRRLIKAAGADRDAVESQFLRDLLATGAISRAGGGFWKSFAKPIGVLADPDICEQLTGMMPEQLTAEEWAGHVITTGLDVHLRDAPDAAGTWTQMLVEHHSRRWWFCSEYAENLAASCASCPWPGRT